MNRVGDNLLCTGTNEAIIKQFSNYQVKFMVIGGLAVSWYMSERQADHMDLMFNPTKENVDNVIKAYIDQMKAINKDIKPNMSFQQLYRPGQQIKLKEYYYADILSPPKNFLTYD